MGKKTYDWTDLFNGIVTIDKIKCTRCQREDETGGNDNWKSSMKFFNIGWRATRLNTYCPVCAKKKLK